MTSRLREILTEREMEVFVRTGHLYEDEKPKVPVRGMEPIDVWGFREVQSVKPVVKSMWGSGPNVSRQHLIGPKKKYSSGGPPGCGMTSSSVSTFRPDFAICPVRKMELSCPVVTGDDLGFCYLRLIHDCHHLVVAAQLGAWPSLLQLLSLPQQVFVGGDVLAVLQCTVSGDRLHIQGEDTAVVKNSVDFLSLLAGLSEDVVPGWAKKVLFRKPVIADGLGCTGSTLVGGISEPIYKAALVGTSYEVLFHDHVRDEVRASLGETPGLSQVFAFPPQYYKSGLVDMGFTLVRGVLQFSGFGGGIRLFVLMRLLLDQLADLKTYPVLRQVRSTKVSLDDLGVKRGVFPTATETTIGKGGFSVQRMSETVKKLLSRLKNFEESVVEETVQSQVVSLQVLGVSVEDHDADAVWQLFARVVRGQEPSNCSRAVLTGYDTYANVFVAWMESVAQSRFPMSDLLEQCGLRASYVVRLLFELMVYLGVNRVVVETVCPTGFVVGAAEYQLFIPVPRPWAGARNGVSISRSCAICGVEHLVQQVAGKNVRVCQHTDNYATDLENFVHGYAIAMTQFENEIGLW